MTDPEITKEVLLRLSGEFSWGFRDQFFIETDIGNFIWSSPDYGGNNTITKYNNTFKNWLKEECLPYARSKGDHTIAEYCGEDFEVVI